MTNRDLAPTLLGRCEESQRKHLEKETSHVLQRK